MNINQYFVELVETNPMIFNTLNFGQYNSEACININGFVLTSSTNLWKAFLKISESFSELTIIFLNNSGVGFSFFFPFFFPLAG